MDCANCIFTNEKKIVFLHPIMKREFALTLLIITLLLSSGASAQTDSPSSTALVNDTLPHRNLFSSTWQWFSRWRERAQTQGFNPGFVSYPKGKPWMVKADSKMSVTYQAMHLPNIVDNDYLSIYNNTGFSSKASLGLYYRGWGVSLGPSLSNKSDLYLDLSSYGRVMGFELKLDYHKSLRSRLAWNANDATRQYISLMGPELIMLELNTYFVFNNKKFSYGSALSQTAWQTQSAGSVIAGLSYLASYTGYDSDFFAQLDYISPFRADTMHLVTRSLALGMGYAYNWVWGNGTWMLHASFLPMLRWSYHKNIEISPNGNLDKWPDSYRDLYLEKTSEIQATSRSQRWAVSGLLRLAFFWNIDEQWVLGAIGSFIDYRDSYRDGIHLSTIDAVLRVYLGFRF